MEVFPMMCVLCGLWWSGKQDETVSLCTGSWIERRGSWILWGEYQEMGITSRLLNVYLFILYVCTWVGEWWVLACITAQRSENSTRSQYFPPVYSVSLRDWILVIRRGGKLLCPWHQPLTSRFVTPFEPHAFFLDFLIGKVGVYSNMCPNIICRAFLPLTLELVSGLLFLLPSAVPPPFSSPVTVEWRVQRSQYMRA